MNGYCFNSMKSQIELPNVENEIKTQNPQWVLSNVHKNGKNNPKMIKTAKGGIHGSLEHGKNGVGENVDDEVAAPFHADLICVVLSPPAIQNYKTAIMSRRITKMPLWALNVDPLTLLTWK